MGVGGRKINVKDPQVFLEKSKFIKENSAQMNAFDILLPIAEFQGALSQLHGKRGPAIRIEC